MKDNFKVYVQENESSFITRLYGKIVVLLKKWCYLLDAFLIKLSATIILLTLFSFVLYVIGFNFILILWIDLLPFNWAISRLIVLLVSGVLRIIFEFRIFTRIANNFKSKYILYGAIVGLVLFGTNKVYYKHISYLDNIKDESYTNGLEEGYSEGYDKGTEIGYSNALVENRTSNNNSYNNGYEVGKSEGYDEGYNEGYSQVKEKVVIKEVEKLQETFASIDTFTIGDSKEKVKQVMGTPTSINVYSSLGEETWYYNHSSITFKDDLVEEYNDNGELKVE